MHCARLAASRAAWTAGKSKAIKTPIIAITTNNSINVNARPDADLLKFIVVYPKMQSPTSQRGDHRIAN
jgi:hypothetical protein